MMKLRLIGWVVSLVAYTLAVLVGAVTVFLIILASPVLFPLWLHEAAAQKEKDEKCQKLKN